MKFKIVFNKNSFYANIANTAMFLKINDIPNIIAKTG
jgi:hypothetical protein